MSNNDWVQQGTPRDDEWTAEQDDYGVPVEPAEWDDYASEQTVPVPPAPAQPEPVEEPADQIEEPAAATPVPEPAPTDPAGEPDAWDEEPASPEFQETAEDTTAAQEAEAGEQETLHERDETALDEPTQHHLPPVAPGTGAGVGPAAVPLAAGAAAGAAAMAGLYRGDTDPERTQVIDGAQHQRLADELAEEERLAEQLRADREARAQRLGLVATSEANAVREAPAARPRGVGHFGSFGLFVLRLVTASILGVVGYQILSDVDATAEFIGRTLIPEPVTVAWSVGFGLAAMAVLLVIGLAVRVVGVLLAIVAGCSLAFIRWGQFSPFVDGMEGFLGDLDLLLLAVGIVFLTLGGGRWGIDGAFAKARQNAREARV
ncbi:hypothetical protein BCR15_11975 [Tessaracoccus lapidicaptus]|uniref:DoxX family protein n=1 Tax=Tessaracoccus lapidicaptus TaxID=1427523 RepID=A0A1C0ARK5_9ACTN|nr:DoxX family protein [Tessaracoccus lapidicaptus]OCL36981.1 hypothetical protein BCR15_11975 [Tessaracoccus lapidicaptus]